MDEFKKNLKELNKLGIHPKFNLFESYKKDADEWLKKYTYDNFNKWPGKHIIQQLLDDYHVVKPIVVYRGLNFNTKEAYEEFLASIKNGYYTDEGISSWSPNFSEAQQFSLTKPSYQLSMSTLSAYHDAQKSHEVVTGYRGIIVSALATPETGIDVRRSKFSKENEIILVPGSYKIRNIKEMKKYADLDDIDPNAIVLSIKKPEQLSYTGDSSYEEGLVRFVLNQRKDELNDKSKKHLYNLLKPKRLSDLYTSNVSGGIFGSDEEVLRYYFRPAYFNYAKDGYFTEADTVNARKHAATVISNIVKELSTNKTPENVELQDFGFLAKFAGVEVYDRYKKVLQKIYGTRYHQLQNSVNDMNKSGVTPDSLKQFSDKVQTVLKRLQAAL